MKRGVHGVSNCVQFGCVVGVLECFQPTKRGACGVGSGGVMKLGDQIVVGENYFQNWEKILVKIGEN